MDTLGHKIKRHIIVGTSAHVHFYNNPSPYDFFNLIISEEFLRGILQEFMNMIAAMKGDGRKGDRDRTKYFDINHFSGEEIDSYLGLLLDNGINMYTQINFWFF